MNVTHPRAESKGANYVKVVVELAKSDWHSYTTESLWATLIKKDVFRIENIPFCAYGVSYQDLSRSPEIFSQMSEPIAL